MSFIANYELKILFNQICMILKFASSTLAFRTILRNFFFTFFAFKRIPPTQALFYYQLLVFMC